MGTREEEVPWRLHEFKLWRLGADGKPETVRPTVRVFEVDGRGAWWIVRREGGGWRARFHREVVPTP